MIKSQRHLSRFINNNCICVDINNSDGLEGNGPDGKKCKLDAEANWITSSASNESSNCKEVKPSSFSKLKNSGQRCFS